MGYTINYRKKILGSLLLAAGVMFIAFPLVRAHAQDAGSVSADTSGSASVDVPENSGGDGTTSDQSNTDFSNDVAQGQQDANPADQIAVTLNQDVGASDVSLDAESGSVSIDAIPVVDTLQEAQMIADSNDPTANPAIDPAIGALPNSDNLSTDDIQAIDLQVNAATNETTDSSIDTSGSDTGADGSGSDTTSAGDATTPVPIPAADTGATDQTSSGQ